MIKKYAVSSNRTYLTWHRTTAEALSSTSQKLDELLRFVNKLYDHAEGSHLVVPDPNALLYNPTLESWRFADIPRFEIILVPAVLRELDHHKLNDRNQAVRDKAESLIRRIKEYRSRAQRIGRTSLAVACHY